jgi:hypothetical protein
MDVVYFILCVLGGIFIVSVPWAGVILAATKGTGKTQRERNIQARKQAAEHPEATGALARDVQERPQS